MSDRVIGRSPSARRLFSRSAIRSIASNLSGVTRTLIRVSLALLAVDFGSILFRILSACLPMGANVSHCHPRTD